MNFTNYDRLVEHLKSMPPLMFDYGVEAVDLERPGCVECQCAVLMGQTTIDMGDFAIQRFLGVTDDEASFIYSSTHLFDPHFGAYIGLDGIANALHRLQVVASRYTRPVKSVLVQDNLTSAERERAFLLTAMEAASQPLESVE